MGRSKKATTTTAKATKATSKAAREEVEAEDAAEDEAEINKSTPVKRRKLSKKTKAQQDDIDDEQDEEEESTKAEWTKDKIEKVKRMVIAYGFDYEKLLEDNKEWGYTEKQYRNLLTGRLKNHMTPEEYAAAKAYKKKPGPIPKPLSHELGNDGKVSGSVIEQNMKRKREAFDSNSDKYLVLQQEKQAKKQKKLAVKKLKIEEEPDDDNYDEPNDEYEEEHDEEDSELKNDSDEDFVLFQKFTKYWKENKVRSSTTPTKGNATVAARPSVKIEAPFKQVEEDQQAIMPMLKPARFHSSKSTHLVFKCYDPFLQFNFSWVKDKQDLVIGWSYSYTDIGWPADSQFKSIIYPQTPMEELQFQHPSSDEIVYSENFDFSLYTRPTEPPIVSPMKLSNDGNKQTCSFFVVKFVKKQKQQESMKLVQYQASE